MIKLKLSGKMMELPMVNGEVLYDPDLSALLPDSDDEIEENSDADDLFSELSVEEEEIEEFSDSEEDAEREIGMDALEAIGDQPFYVVKTNTVYQLRITSTHYCLSALSDPARMLEVLAKRLRKHGSPEAIIKNMRKMEDGGRVGEVEYRNRELQYLHREIEYDAAIEKLIAEIMQERINSLQQRTKRTFKVVSLPQS